MEPLKIGITGVRGVVGQTLTPELVVRFAEAFGAYLDGGRVLVCRDPRPSGPMLQAAVTAGLLSVGCEVVDLGICPTPSLQLEMARSGAAGGISITGGHNPADWNALKFVRGDGLYLNAIQGEELLDVYHQGAVARVGWDRMATRVREQDAIEPHLRALLVALRRRAGARAPAAGRRRLRQRLVRAARAALARGARLRGAADQRRPDAAVPALAGARRRRRRPRRARSCWRARPTSAWCSTPTASG